MVENLPPPNWSPTGNSGEWYWGNEKAGKEKRGCWKWRDDVYGEMKSKDITRLRQQGVTIGITTAENAEVWKKYQEPFKRWWQKLFLAFVLLALTVNAQSPIMSSSQFVALLPKEVYGEKGNFTLCFKCATCKSKKFQRLYVRYHLGRTIND